MASLIDWQVATRTASRLAPATPSVTPAEAQAVVADLQRCATDAAQHVAELTRLTEPPVTAPTNVVDRPGWIGVNATGMSSLMDPIVSRLTDTHPPSKFAQSVGGKVTGAQAGAVLAFLSGKVLGQFEFFAAPGGQLLLVAPNIVSVERALRLDAHDFRLWVCLHEVTHRVQFTAVPWLRDHMVNEVTALTDAMDTDPDALRERLRSVTSELANSVRGRGARTAGDESTSGVLQMLTTPEQRVVLDRLTAFMSLVEGHAEYVMNAVSPAVIPTQPLIETRFAARRRKGGNPLDRLMRRLLGLDAKTRQYVDGSAFVRSVVARIGIDSFNAIWTSPNTLPTRAEIASPDLWVARVHD